MLTFKSFNKNSLPEYQKATVASLIKTLIEQSIFSLTSVNMYAGGTRKGIQVITHRWSWIPSGSQRSFCSCHRAANLWGVHLLDLHQSSGFSFPTDRRQYGSRELELLLKLGLHNHPGPKWTWRCRWLVCVVAWNQVKAATHLSAHGTHPEGVSSFRELVFVL